MLLTTATLLAAILFHTGETPTDQDRLDSALSFVIEVVSVYDAGKFDRPSRCVIRQINSLRDDKGSMGVSVVDLAHIDPSKVTISDDRLYVEATNLQKKFRFYKIGKLESGGYYRNAEPLPKSEYFYNKESWSYYDKDKKDRLLKAFRFAVTQCGGKEGW